MCPSYVRAKKKKKRPNCYIMALFEKMCHKELPIKYGNSLLTFKVSSAKYKNGLPMHNILELLWLFLYSKGTLKQIVGITGRSATIVVEWWNTFRKVCCGALEIEQPYNGTLDKPVQIDESYFARGRKYRPGRFLSGDSSKRLTENEDSEEEKDLFGIENNE